MKTFVALLVSALLFGLTACTPISASVTPAEQSGEGSCVASRFGARLLQNAVHGYCLQYPSVYSVAYPNVDEMVLMVGSLLNVAEPRVMIAVTDAAGWTAQARADEILADMAGFAINQDTVSIDGETAIVLDGLPGQDLNRQLIFVHADRLYQMTFLPVGAEYGEVAQKTEALYRMVLDSFTFLEP